MASIPQFRTKLTQLTLAVLLVLSLITGAQAQQSAERFIDEINQSLSAANQYDYELAIKHLNSAEILYRRTLKEFTDLGEDPAEIWKLNLAMQTNLVGLYNMLGTRLFDQENYSDALRMYQKSEAINPRFPCTQYELGYTYLNLIQPWKAAVAIYKAKQLARIPAYRGIVNHFDESGSIYCPREQVESRSDGILKDLGKSTLYPLDLDLATGKNIPNQAVPGMGAHLAKRKQSIYLEQSWPEAEEMLGITDKTDEIEDEQWGKLTVYYYPEISIAVEPASQSIKQLYMMDQGRPVMTPAGLVYVGDTAQSVMKKLGQNHGFIRLNGGLNDSLREMLVYAEIGLSFGIGKDGRVGMILIADLD